MPQLDTIFTVMLAGILLSASPGPSMAYVLSRSVQFGAAGGLASSLGLALGGMLHALLAALGLALLAVKFPVVLQVVKYVGAAYLAYLAYDALQAALSSPSAASSPSSQANAAPASAESASAKAHAPLGKLFAQGVLIELSNPKTIIFFLSFMPQFVVGHSTGGVLLLSSLIPLTAIPADLIAIFAGGLVANAVQGKTWVMRAVNGAVALVLLGIALMVLLR